MMIDCNESVADFHQQETIPTSNTNDTTADSTENIMNINVAKEPISGSGSGSSSSVSRAEIALDKINPKDSSTWEDLRFSTKIDAQSFYKRYARLNGFKVKNRLSQKSGKEGGNEYRYLYFTCNKEGYRKDSELDPKNKGKANTKKVVRKNPETRIGCKANIKLRPTRGANNWFAIFEFNNDHNHSCAQDKHKLYIKQQSTNFCTIQLAAIFVGKNQHHHLVIFGAALLYDETSATFEWLFSTFKKCMNGNEPTTIFTDQCAAIKAGITSVFPESNEQ
ncbi:Protein FAR1-RELATED SEQUENCE 5 [Linum perenne]